MSYYGKAFHRAVLSAWDWPNSHSIAFGLLALALGAAFVFSIELIWRRVGQSHRWIWLQRFGMTAVAGIVLAFCGCFIIFFIGDAPEQAGIAREQIETTKATAQDAIARVEQENRNLRAQLEVRNAKGLFVECHMGQFLRTIPPDGRWYVLDIFRQENILLAEDFGPPGSETAMPQDFTPLNAAACTLSNYSDDPIFSVELRPTVSFIPPIRRPDGGVEGHDSNKRVIGWANVPKLDVGSDKSVTFYILNHAFDFVNVTFPNQATAQRLGSTDRFSLPVAANYERGIELSPYPFMDTK